MSKKSSSSSTSSQYNTQNLAIDGVDGVSLVGDGSSIVVTDNGAVSAAMDYAGGAFSKATDIVGGALKLSNENYGITAGIIDKTLDYGAENYDALLEANRDAIGGAINLVGSNTASVFDYLKQSEERALNSVSSANARALDAVAATVKTDSAATLEQVTKWILIAVVGFAVVSVVRN